MTLFSVLATLCVTTNAHGTLCKDIPLIKHATVAECLIAEERDVASWMAQVRQIFGVDYELVRHSCQPFIPPQDND